MLDWDNILKCGINELKDCGELYLYISIKKPNLFIILVVFSMSLFTFCKVLIFLYNYNNLISTYNFYKDVLKITTHELQTSSWYKIINGITKLEPSENSMYDITNKILRKENYFIALLHKDVINISSKNLYFCSKLFVWRMCCSIKS